MKKIPCINCITFPICLSEYRESRLKDLNKDYRFKSISMVLSRCILKDKCKLLKKYILNSYDDNRYIDTIKEFNKIFEHESWKNR